jgi:hypothetical protein
MRIQKRWYAAWIVALVVTLGSAWSSAAAPKKEGFGTMVQVSPGAQSGTFQFKIRVTQLTTGKPIAGGKVNASPGSPGQIESTDPDSGVSVLFKATVDKPTSSVVYSFVLRKGDVVVSEQEGTMILQMQLKH